ncbi:MAG: GNAT family N-acetyltransferase [Candidatus Korobacteraceae bacterium]
MMASEEFVLRTSVPADISAIVALINRAFAVEKFFKSGERIDTAGLVEMLLHGEFLLLESGRALIACVFVKITGERAYAGTLAVDPSQQKSGIGRRMMLEAEDYARAHGCEVLDIRIVNVRPELSEIYTKLGFVPTGIESAEVIKTATQPVHFITMSKAL